MRKKVIGALIIVAFISMALPLVPLATQVSGSAQATQVLSVVSVNLIGINTESVDSKAYTPSSGFYADLGMIYTVRTQDGVNIKMLRYHPAGEGFNYGAQSILLFPGLLANINEFLAHSTDRLKQLYGDIILPDELADWAVGDENIEEDPLLYYSIAYYLWSEGYDVWLANYRGVGYKEMKSERGSTKTSLDTWALYDARAALRKVYDVTGKHPIIGGHSTGGLVSMILLQGCYFKWDGHVASSDSLTKQRNGITTGPETIKGFIALEPAGIPVVTDLLDNYLFWKLLDTDLYIDIRSILETLDGTGDLSLIQLMVTLLEQLGPELKDLITNILNMDVDNLTPELGYFYMAYALDSIYLRTIAQYLDFAWQNTMREFFKNGFWNQFLVEPPNPRSRDGYYYYINNMQKMSVPMITILATMQNNFLDLVNSTQIIEDYINGKTHNMYDEYYFVEGAHIDAPIGIHAPVDVFPHIGEWLTKIA